MISDGEFIERQIQENREASVPTGLRAVAARFARASAVYGVANFGVRALNFLLIPLYAHYLSPTDYGTIYLAETVAIFVLLFGNLAIDSAIQRLYFQHNLDQSELNSYLGTSIRFGLGAIVLMVMAAYWIGPLIQRNLSRTVEVAFHPFIATALITAALTQGVQYCMAVFQAERKPRASAVFSILLFTLTAGCCVYAVAVRHDGAVGMLSGKLAASFAIFVVAAWSMRKFLLARFQWRFVRETLTFSLPLVPHQVMAGGLIVADRFILEHYRDVNEVGIYSLAYTIGMVMFLVTQSLAQAWTPMFFEFAGGAHDNRRVLGRMSSGLLIVLIALACTGILFAPQFVHHGLSGQYRAADRIIPIVIMGYLFHAFFSLLTLSIMHAKRTSYIFVISSLACAVNILLNFVLIPRWGMYGAAWATFIAYACEALCAFAIAQRLFALPYRLGEIVPAVAICGGALWLTQTSWAVAQQWWAALTGLIMTLLVLALIGRKDLWLAFEAFRRMRLSKV